MKDVRKRTACQSSWCTVSRQFGRELFHVLPSALQRLCVDQLGCEIDQSRYDIFDGGERASQEREGGDGEKRVKWKRAEGRADVAERLQGRRGG